MTEEARRQKALAEADARLRHILSTREGRAWWWELLTRAGLHGGSFSTEPLEMAYAEGRRSVALEVAGDAQRVCPELYAAALREALDAEALRRQQG